MCCINFAQAGSKMVIEGERYASIRPSMMKANSQVASGGVYVHIPLLRPHATTQTGPSDIGNCVYKVNVSQAGTYVFWFRAHWYDACGNSFFVIIDNKPAVFVEDSTYQVWHWVKGPSVALAAGEHTIRIQNREDGAKLDQFLLINSIQYVPTRIEKATQ